MAKAYYDPTIPVGIVVRPGFYAYPIEVPEKAIEQAANIRRLIEQLDLYEQHAAMPNQAQELADFVVENLDNMMKARQKHVTNTK